MADGRIELTLAHSPDADDVAMFWPIGGLRGPDGAALAGASGEAEVTSARFTFRVIADDVQRLNRRAIEAGDLDITAISAHAYPMVRRRYAITRAGGSFGEGYGPKVVVGRGSWIRDVGDLAQGATIVVPGVHTTAYLTLCVLLGRRVPAEEMLFSDIPGAVARGDFDAGLLIHEAQLSHEDAGLRQVGDLGVLWRKRAGAALPLGLNVVRRDLDDRFGAGSIAEVSRVIKDSISHAMAHRAATRAYLRAHAGDRREWLDDELIDRYLDMYVSEMTRDMGEAGISALRRLYDEGERLGLVARVGEIDAV